MVAASINEVVAELRVASVWARSSTLHRPTLCGRRQIAWAAKRSRICPCVLGCAFLPSKARRCDWRYRLSNQALDRRVLAEVLEQVEGPAQRVLVVDDDPDSRAFFERMLLLGAQPWR